MLDPLELGRRSAEAPIEVVIFATDVSDEDDAKGTDRTSSSYSSHETPPEILAQAMLASAAISALVLPLPVGDRIATDGGWVRNFPLGAALDHPDVNLVVAFRYVPRYPHIGIASLGAGPARVCTASVPSRPSAPSSPSSTRRRRASSAASRSISATCCIRLMRVAIQRNTALEERLADERDAAIRELDALRADVTRIVHASMRGRAVAAGRHVPSRSASRGPRCRGRVPRITVRGSGGAESLDAGFRGHREWSEDVEARPDRARLRGGGRELAAHGDRPDGAGRLVGASPGLAWAGGRA